MQQVYRVNKPIKIIYCLGIAGVLSYLIYLFLPDWKSGNINNIVLSLCAALGCVLLIANTIITRLIITDSGIIYIRLFSKRKLEFENILGFELNGRMIDIVPNDPKFRRLSVYDYVKDDGSESLMQWFEKNLTDLDRNKQSSA